MITYGRDQKTQEGGADEIVFASLLFSPTMNLVGCRSTTPSVLNCIILQITE